MTVALGYVDGLIVNIPDGEPSASITANGTPGGTTIPTLVLGYETSMESRNIIHDLIDGGIAASLIAPRPRSGDLRLFYPAEADAWASFGLHSLKTTFTLTEASRPSIGMTYVVSGALRLELDDQTRDVWVVTVPYQEVVV